MAFKLTQEQFIEKAIKIHGNKFEYLLIDKINSSIKVYKGNICLIKMQ